MSLTERGIAFLFTLRSLSTGSEISLSHGPRYTEMNADERQVQLNNTHLFQCNCEAYSKSWDTATDKSEMIRCLQCFSVHQENNFRCSKCGSKEGRKIVNSLKSKWIPRYASIIYENAWTLEDLKMAANQVIVAHSILAHPSKPLALLNLSTKC